MGGETTVFVLFLIICLSFISACPSGFFKPTQGDEPCLQCPINSRTTSEGAMNCVCRNGYYRTDSDPLQMPCTSTLKKKKKKLGTVCRPLRIHPQNLWFQV